MTNILVQHVARVTRSDMMQAEYLFIHYFTALYRDIVPSTLGIYKPTSIYLQEIWNKTKQALEDDVLSLSFAYIENNIVGMSTYELIEDTFILVRTLPIHLNYIGQEKNIRATFIKHICSKVPHTKNIIIMVRKANAVHQNLCLENGFKRAETVFDIPFIQQQYNDEHYYGYLHIKE